MHNYGHFKKWRQRAPKQWCLTNVKYFTNCKQNLQYTLSLDSNFKPFLIDGATWGKKVKADPYRGQVDTIDQEGVIQKTRETKLNMLELMLGQIANYCPIIARNTIVKNSTSVASIWQAIRLHYGFQSTVAHFLDVSSI